jgi:SAM-dependent methyltransferase
MTPIPPPGRYAALNFNAPMSLDLADTLAKRLVSRGPTTVLDVGCGWAEMLLRVLALTSSATGLGVDDDEALLERARANAKLRDLHERVRFQTNLPTPAVDSADVVICIGADHIFGSQRDALVNLRSLVNLGGLLLFGTGYWEKAATIEEAASIGATPEDFRTLAGLVDLATDAGFRLLDLRTATRREWEEFEFGYLADWEDWLMDWSNEPEATNTRARADTHRMEYLSGWRDVMGFAYLVLGRPRPADSGRVPTQASNVPV